ncbi:MAG: TlpA disulfide reductase family protein [Gammaproteobacteria bacterium]|nr:TlpA disulfide reductase family protein [Gammaproteobacteria bacterium]
MNSKILHYAFVGAAMLAAFAAGNYVMKLYHESTPAAKAAKAMESQYRPGFELPDLDGKLRNINEWNGKVVVVNFWATWCPPCKKEMPAFMDLHEKYGPEGLEFVGVALDEPGKVQDFVDTLGVEYPILVGGEKAIKASEDYGNRLGALPYTAVINREGYIVKTYRGEVSYDSLDSAIQKNL